MAQQDNALNPTDPQPGSDRSEQFVLQFLRAEQTLHAFILSIVPNWTDAEEVLQQTSLILWRKFDDYQAGTSFLSWACQIARYEALNHRKKHRRDRHVFSDELIGMMAEEAADDAERMAAERRALAHCIAKLKDKHQQILKRCYQRGVSIKTIAQEMGQSANSVYKSLDRIRQRLMACVQTTLAEDPA